MRSKRLFGITTALAYLALVSVEVAAATYDNVKTLMFEAIDAPDGRAQGEIVGPIADKFRETTKSSAPVMAEVTTIKSFKQEGCKRLNVRLMQANVPTKDGKTTDFAIDYGINLCRDGSPPTEGMDLEKVGRVLDLGGAGEAAGMGRQPVERP